MSPAQHIRYLQGIPEFGCETLQRRGKAPGEGVVAGKSASSLHSDNLQHAEMQKKHTFCVIIRNDHQTHRNKKGLRNHSNQPSPVTAKADRL